MGRIDEALRRSRVDVGLGTSAPAPAPWRFGAQDSRGAGGEGPSRATETAPVEGGAQRTAPVNRRSVPRAGADSHAVERIIVSNEAPALLVEQFRSLAATLLGAQREQPLKSVIVTSASRRDGKSLVAINLALTLSESYRRRVLLVDADLRRPSLHKVFGAPHARGLSDALEAGADVPTPLVQITDTLTLLAAGEPQQDPLGGLSSARMHGIIADAVARFDWVIVDTPPVGVLADGRLVCEMVDGAILIVMAGVTRFPDLEAAIDTIGRERVLGIVLNGADPDEIRGEGDYRRDDYRSHDGGAGCAR
jgi:protein-tyrosine kinase